MGKLLRQQRRGKGSTCARAPSHRYKVDLQLRPYDQFERTGVLRGLVSDIIDDPGRQGLVMEVMFENGESQMLLAPEGICVGDELQSGRHARQGLGSSLPLSQVSDGALIYNIELAPGDGGKLARAPGSYATIISHEGGYALVKLPSRRVIYLQETCRAQLGIVAGGGRLEKPLMKAGTNHYKKHAQNRKWPVNRGVKMCAYTHPFGGKQHHKGRGSSTSRGAPPGRKVGHIAARGTGRGSAARKRERLAEEQANQ